LGPWRLPCCGGGYLRHFPLVYNLWAMRRIEGEQRSVVVYLHPHEIDPSFDREYLARHLGRKKLAEARWNVYAQHRNRAKTVTRLRSLLSLRRFGSIARVFRLECPATIPLAS